MVTAADRQAALFRAWLAAGGMAVSWVEAQRRMRIMLGDPT